MEVRLPMEKLDKCTTELQKYLSHSKITLRDLQSIVGLLNFTCAVVTPGRAFLRRMIDLTMTVRKPFHFIRLTQEVKQDMCTWLSFLSEFNGRSLLLPERWAEAADLHLYTDASGSLGYGAIFGNHCFLAHLGLGLCGLMSWRWGVWCPVSGVRCSVSGVRCKQLLSFAILQGLV